MLEEGGKSPGHLEGTVFFSVFTCFPQTLKTDFHFLPLRNVNTPSTVGGSLVIRDLSVFRTSLWVSTNNLDTAGRKF